jgi:hypothetical protein
MHEMKPEEPDFLSHYNVASPFSVPDGYFDNLSICIANRLPHEKQSVFQREWFPRLAVASSFVTVSICAILFFFNAPQKAPIVGTETASEAQTYEEILEEEGVLEYVNDEEFIGQFDAELAALYPAPQTDTIATEIEEIILSDDLDELELYLEL